MGTWCPPSLEYGRGERDAERKGIPSILDHTVLDRAEDLQPVEVLDRKAVANSLPDHDKERDLVVVIIGFMESVWIVTTNNVWIRSFAH